jgi:hypothetical protein
MIICKTPTCEYVNMVVSQVILSGITLEPRVDPLVGHYGHTSRITYDNAIMSPLLGSEKPSAVRIIMGHTY